MSNASTKHYATNGWYLGSTRQPWNTWSQALPIAERKNGMLTPPVMRSNPLCFSINRFWRSFSTRVLISRQMPPRKNMGRVAGCIRPMRRLLECVPASWHQRCVPETLGKRNPGKGSLQNPTQTSACCEQLPHALHCRSEWACAGQVCPTIGDSNWNFEVRPS